MSITTVTSSMNPYLKSETVVMNLRFHFSEVFKTLEKQITLTANTILPSSLPKNSFGFICNSTKVYYSSGIIQSDLSEMLGYHTNSFNLKEYLPSFVMPELDHYIDMLEDFTKLATEYKHELNVMLNHVYTDHQLRVISELSPKELDLNVTTYHGNYVVKDDLKDLEYFRFLQNKVDFDYMVSITKQIKAKKLLLGI